MRNLVEELFIIALKQATEKGDLWWQVRSLQELGWRRDLDELVLQHAAEIDKAGDLQLLELLERARGNAQLANDIRKQAHGQMRTVGPGIVFMPSTPEDSSQK